MAFLYVIKYCRVIDYVVYYLRIVAKLVNEMRLWWLHLFAVEGAALSCTVVNVHCYQYFLLMHVVWIIFPFLTGFSFDTSHLQDEEKSSKKHKKKKDKSSDSKEVKSSKKKNGSKKSKEEKKEIDELEAFLVGDSKQMLMPSSMAVPSGGGYESLWQQGCGSRDLERGWNCKRKREREVVK